MLLFLAWWSAALSATEPEIQAPPPAKETVKSDLKIRYDDQQINFETKRQFYRGKVQAEYDVTTLQSSELEIDEAGKQGWARGGVKLLDPEGTLEAEEIYFKWRSKDDPMPGPDEVVARATKVKMVSGNVHLTGDTFEIKGGLWIMTNATGALTQRENPEWKIRARKVSLVPGVRGTAEHIYLEILGVKLGPLARYGFNLNPRIESKFTLPTWTRDEKGRFGLSWSFSRPLSDTSALKGSWSSFPRQLTSWNLTYAFSPLATTRTRAKVSTPSDLSERFDDGWMDNIQVIGPDKEAEDFRAQRLNYQFQTDWNSGVSARTASPSAIVRLADISMEGGGAKGNFGLRYTGRLQHIRSAPSEPYRTRALLQAGAQGPRMDFGGGLSGIVRLDGLSSLSDKGGYGWLRGQAALIFQPNKEVRLGAAYVKGLEFGRPDFEFDRLFSDQALHLRADVLTGPFTFRYLTKYDFRQGKIYDREYEVAYVAGAFEPFIQYREFPSNYQFGLRFRMDDFVNRLVSREQKRKAPSIPSKK